MILSSESCLSGETVSRTKSKGWRACIRTANVFSELPVAVETKIFEEALKLE